jgi:MFS family permease
MPQEETLMYSHLRTPRAAAVAGIVFSVLLVVIFWIFRSAVPADPLDPGTWLANGSGSVALALNLIPFAGIAFLWFIGVLRDRLGPKEDRFFATVFLGSGLLFLATLFVAATVVGALLLIAPTIETTGTGPAPTFRFGRAVAYILFNVYAIKMAGVFMISTSTVVISTGIAPRWMAGIGYALAVLVLLGSFYLNWSIMVLPLWVLLISVHILIENLRGRDNGLRQQ